MIQSPTARAALVYAHSQDSQRHYEYLTWLEELINSDQAYGLSDLVLSGFIRVVTHQKVFTPTSTMNAALASAHELHNSQTVRSSLPDHAIGISSADSAIPQTSKGTLCRMHFWLPSPLKAGVNGSQPTATISFFRPACPAPS